MVFSHSTGSYNVYSSLAAWLNAQIIANKPPLIDTVLVTLGYVEDELTPPQWSLHFHGSIPGATYTGDVVDSNLKGRRVKGICEINCWVTRKLPAWQGQLLQMQDAVTEALSTVSSIPIMDFYTNVGAPTVTANRVFLDRWETRLPPVDPNPDIERKRILVYFTWIERA